MAAAAQWPGSNFKLSALAAQETLSANAVPVVKTRPAAVQTFAAHLDDADVAFLKGVLELCVVQAPDGGAHLFHRLKLCHADSLTAVAVDVSEARLHHLTEVVLQATV